MESGRASGSGIQNSLIHGTVVAITDFVGFYIFLKIPTYIWCHRAILILEVTVMEDNVREGNAKEKGNVSTSDTNVTEAEFQRVADRVSVITIVGNVILSIFKLFAGIMAHSSAMISDAIHSASDVFSTFIVIIGIRLASKKPDKEHPYGHERMECVAAIVLAITLFITGLGIGMDAFNNIIKGGYDDLQVPGMLALIAAVVSIVIKEMMYWYTRHYAIKLDSGALMADAWHHRSDAFSSVGALIGIGGARLGYPVMDSVASLVIFIFITKAAFDIFKDSVDKMVDHSCDEETERQIYECVMDNKDVIGIDLLQTRVFGNKIYVDVEIEADGSYTLLEAHDIAEAVHQDIEKSFPKVKHIMVHVNPAR